jgi:hypothetical protein
MGYFIHLFKTRIEAILRSLTRHSRPRAIVVCMIYFLDETPGRCAACLPAACCF